MTTPPLPTFIPQDEWYNLTTGQINPSVASTVPNITYLQPASTVLGLVDGLTGALDTMIIYLAGLSSALDGGQKFLMWVAASMQADDGVNTFNPWADPTTPGRWINTGTPQAGPGATVSVQTIEAGGTKDISPTVTAFVTVYIQGRSTSGATTLNLPGSTFLGQAITVKDVNGDAGTDNIIVVAASIDGAASDTLTNDFQERGYSWNGTEWSIS
jgi:hypothetical protein